LDGIVADTTTQSAVIIDIDAESTNALTITGSKGNNDTINVDGAVDFSAETITISAVEKLTIDNDVSFKAATLSGQTLSITGASTDVITLAGTAAADTVDTSNLTATANAVITIDGAAGADTITLGAMAETILHEGNASDGVDTITGFTVGTDFINIDSDLVSTDGGKGTDGNADAYATSAIIDLAADTAAADAGTDAIWWVAEELASTTTASNAVANAVTELADGTDFSGNFVAGEGGIIIMDNGSDTFLFEYKAAGTATTTEAGDLTLIAVLDGLADGDTLTATEFV
jgi:hypothetical protein